MTRHLIHLKKIKLLRVIREEIFEIILDKNEEIFLRKVEIFFRERYYF